MLDLLLIQLIDSIEKGPDKEIPNLPLIALHLLLPSKQNVVQQLSPEHIDWPDKWEQPKNSA
jgi:hypothetical protein